MTTTQRNVVFIARGGCAQSIAGEFLMVIILYTSQLHKTHCTAQSEDQWLDSRLRGSIYRPTPRCQSK